jgi:hypothetical protein
MTNPAGQMMWKQPADLGTANFLFIEDNVFDNTATASALPIYDTAGGGGRTVIRYNTIDRGFFNHHWVRGDGASGGDWCGTILEVYRNVFAGDASFNFAWGSMESGTGVFYENQTSGYKADVIGLSERRAEGTESNPAFDACDGTETHDGNAGDASAPGWPCLGQVGRAPGLTLAQIIAGTKQTSLPLHLWKNGADAGCATGGSCTNSSTVSINAGAVNHIKATGHTVTGGGYGQGEVDYILGGDTPKPGYTAYTYPHPKTVSWP